MTHLTNHISHKHMVIDDCQTQQICDIAIWDIAKQIAKLLYCRPTRLIIQNVSPQSKAELCALMLIQ